MLKCAGTMLGNTIKDAEYELERITIYGDAPNTERVTKILRQLVADLREFETEFESEYEHKDNVQATEDELTEAKNEIKTLEQKIRNATLALE